MTADEIIAEIRSIAEAMAIRDVEPGFISGSVQYRARTLLLKTGVPMQPWENHRQYLTKLGTATLNGKTVETQVHKATIDDTMGELCRAIVGALLLVDWRIHPDWQHWTAEQAERAIIQAAERLPKLCDQLESKQSTNSSHSNWPTITKVAKGLDKNRGTVSRLLDCGELRDNGMKNNARRIDPASVLEYCEANGVTYNET